jgi:ankyrin repeat protein
MGVYNATRVASNIRLSFKEVRLALVVGVCGGAPLKQPIILGDIIISNSVIEFYTGRQYPDGVQARRGVKHTLGRPNPEIRALLSKLEIPLIRQELEGEIQQNLVELRKKSDTAQYPGAELDRLFAASYRHMHRAEPPSQECLCTLSQSDHDPVCSEALASSCDVLGCDVEASGTPSRRMRFASGVPTPLVHIGTVGGTSVMKSGEHRDTIARENDIIAFEMEGAGVWEDLPCIIVKGVCDYADSHKNKIWQNYAAAAAASAAKAFLDYWTSGPRNSVAAEGSSRKRPHSISDEDDARPSRRVRQQSLSRRQSSMSDLHRIDGTNSTPLDPTQGDSNARQSRLDALSFEQLDTRHATIKAAHAATCEWLLNKSEYTDWQDEEKLHEHHGFLWIKGKPGAGKSTIMKFAYTNAKKNSKGSVAISYFFNARGETLEKSTRGMYRSLLFQLLSKIPKLQAVLDTPEAANLQKTSPDAWTMETLQSLFRQTIERLEDQHLTCFVDALDECENNEDQVREMICFFEALGECAVRDNTRFLVCFSSRHYPHITIDKGVELTLEVQQGHSEDITRYVNSNLKVGHSKRVEQIKVDVQKKSQGIFLWVVLVLPMLKKAHNHGQVHALDKCLKDIPEDLNELFYDILGRDNQNIENLVLCLRWILYAERPLSAEELYFAMLSASETGAVTAWDPEDITLEDIKRFILSSSKGLAEPTRSKTPTIQFIHESVRDFLLKENGLALLQLGVDCTSAGPIHDSLKGHCQRYFSSVPTNHSLKSSEKTLKMFPFLNYSILHVLKHAELAASYKTPQGSFLEHFPLGEWISLHDRIEQYKIRRYGSGTSLLYIITEKNLFHLFQVEVGQSQAINTKGGRYDFPIIAAAALGHTQMLDLLLKHGADPDKRSREHKHALFPAVDKSDASAVKVLMEHGAISSSNEVSMIKYFVALLEKAVTKRQTSITKLLLQDRKILAAKVSIDPEFERTVGTAVRNEDYEILEMLIQFAVTAPGRYRWFDHAMVMASRYSQEGIVRIMLESAADLGTSRDAYGSSLLEAVRINHETIVGMLLEHGADSNTPDQFGTTGLHIASRRGYETIVRILLEHGADSNASDASGSTGLHLASRYGYETIIRILLEHGADVNVSSGSGSTGLHIAAQRGDETIARFLLENDASVDTLDAQQHTALWIASVSDWPAIVRVLLEFGANVHEGNPLYHALYATVFACEAVAAILLEYGADPNRYSEYPSNDLPLHMALVWGAPNIVKLLLDHGADVNIPSCHYEDASSALEPCFNVANRAACEVLLRERRVWPSSVPFLIWFDGAPYLNFPQETSNDTALYNLVDDQATRNGQV